ncbi:MAG: adenylyltransferase [Rhodospirillales bacterium]|nr:adenylyltransferase [Rhodospirillales bacterium]
MKFTDKQLQRYARHIILPEVGGLGQEKLLTSSVLVIGAGGLGAPVLLYLAAAGVGKIGVVDDDVVDLSNLQRQVIHNSHSIGKSKVESASTTIKKINNEINFQSYKLRLTAHNVVDLISDYEIIVDGSDNFETRFLLNDACHLNKKTLISGAILRFEGQVATFKSHIGQDYPCYRCLYREPPPNGLVPSCSEGGVLGALAGTVGSLQATEVLKEIMGIGSGLDSNLLLYDALEIEFRKMTLKPDRDCPLCGDNPSILDLSSHIAK